MDGLRSVVAATAAASAAVLLLHHGMVTAGFSVLPGDVGDSRFVQLALEHGYRWLSGQTKSLWDLPMFFPATNTFAYSEVMLGVAPPYWLARGFGAGPDAAYAFWFVVTTSLNAVTFFAFCRRVPKFGVPAAMLSAVLFAAAASKGNLQNHPQLLPMYLPVIALWGVLRVVSAEAVRERRRWLATAAAALVLQLWGGFYVGWFTVFLLTCAFGGALLRRESRAKLTAALRRDVLATALVFGAALLLLAPLAVRYLRVAGELGVRRWEHVLLPYAQSWLNVGDASWFWSSLHSLRMFQVLPTEGEQRMGLGVITTFVALAVVVLFRREPWVRALALFTVVVCGLATVWRYGVTPWWLVYKLFPGGSAIRAVPRLGVFLSIPAALAVGLLAQRRPRGFAGLLALLVAIACVAEQGVNHWHFSPATSRRNVDAIAAAVPRDCRAFLAVAPYERVDFEHQLDAAWAAVQLGIPTVNGYSGNAPVGWHFEKNLPRAEAERLLPGWTSEPVCVVDAPAGPR